MKEKKTSAYSNGLIWFGAAVSIAEIMTGTLLAPLGFAKGLAAILTGHAIGCTLLFFAGWIGGKTQKSAMEAAKLSFGQKGALLFALLNVLQLIGWTAIMIAGGASAAEAVLPLGDDWIWSLIIGLLIIVWLLVGIKNLSKINVVAMSALFFLTLLLSAVVFKGGSPAAKGSPITFGAAIELSVAMPLSWLPLISDYTRTAKKPFAASMTSSVVYFLTSSWMYVIGMSAALFTGKSDISAILATAKMGILAPLIIIFATVTTTFLDAYSAGVSSVSISAKLKEKPVAVAVCILGILLAVFTPITQFEDFLYLIGSVFAPMIAVQIADYFMLKRDASGTSADRTSLICWFTGFLIYRIFLGIDTPMGNTLPVMVLTAILTVSAHKLKTLTTKNLRRN